MSTANLNYVINMTAGGLDELQAVIGQLQQFKQLVEQGASFPIRIEGGLLDKLTKDVREAVQEAFVAPPGGGSAHRQMSGNGAPVELNADGLITAMTTLTAALNRQGGSDSAVAPGQQGVSEVERLRVSITQAVDGLKASQEGMKAAIRTMSAAAPSTDDAAMDTPSIQAATAFAQSRNDLAQMIARTIITAQEAGQGVLAKQLARAVDPKATSETYFRGMDEGELTRKLSGGIDNNTANVAALFVKVGKVVEDLGTALSRLPAETGSMRTPNGRLSGPSADLMARTAFNDADLQTIVKSIASQLVVEIARQVPAALASGREEADKLANARDYKDLPDLPSERASATSRTLRGNAAGELDRDIKATEQALNDARARQDDEAEKSHKRRLEQLREERAVVAGVGFAGVSQREAAAFDRTSPNSSMRYYLAKGSDFMSDIETSAPVMYDAARRAVQQKFVPVAGQGADFFTAQTISGPVGITQQDILASVTMMSPGAKGLRTSQMSAADDRAIFGTNDEKGYTQRARMAAARQQLTGVAAAFPEVPVIPVAAADQLQNILVRAIDGVAKAKDAGSGVDRETGALLDAMLRLPVFKRFQTLPVETSADQRAFLDVARPMLEWLKGGRSIVYGAGRSAPSFREASGMRLNDVYNESVGGASTSGGDRTKAGYTGIDPLSEVYESAAFRDFPMTPFAIEQARKRKDLTPEQSAALDKDEEDLTAFMETSGVKFLRNTENRAEAIERRLNEMIKLYTAIAQNNIIPAKYTGLLGQGGNMSPEGFQRYIADVDNTLPEPVRKQDLRIDGSRYTDRLTELATAIATLMKERLGGGVVTSLDSPIAQRRGLRGTDGQYYLGTVNEYDMAALQEQNPPQRLQLPLYTKERTAAEGVGLVTQPDQLRYVMQWLKGQGQVALDIETNATRPEQGDIRSIQLALPQAVDGLRAIVIDLKEIGKDSATLKEVMRMVGAEGVTKLGHNLKFEADWLQAKLGVDIGTNRIDTLDIERALLAQGGYAGGKAGADLEAGVDRRLQMQMQGKGDIQLSFGQQGELNEDQIRYAVTDVLILFKFLQQQLADLGKLDADKAKAAIQKLTGATGTLSNLVASGVDVGGDFDQQIIAKLRAQSDNFELLPDGSAYRDKTTNNLLDRVTSRLQELRSDAPLTADQLARGETAREIGTVVDRLVRDVLEGKDVQRGEYLNASNEPVTATQQIFDSIVAATKKLKADLTAQGWSVIDSGGITLGDTRRGVAGTTDILLVNKAGQLGVVDTKIYGGKQGRINRKINEVGGYGDQVNEYANIASDITGAPTVFTGIFGLNTDYETGNAVIQGVRPQNLIPVQRRREIGQGFAGFRPEGSQQRLAQLERQIDALDAVLRDLKFGDNASALERARQELNAQGVKIRGELSASQLIQSAERRAFALRRRRDSELQGGQGEINAQTGQQIPGVSPGIQALDPLDAAKQAGQTQARQLAGVMDGDCCKQIVEAIQAFQKDVVKRMGQRGSQTGSSPRDLMNALTQSGAFAPADLRMIGKKLAMSDIEIETKRRKQEMDKDGRADRERERMLRQTDRFMNYDPTTQTQLIAENQRLFAENASRFQAIAKTAARAVNSSATARDKAAVDLQYTQMGALTEAESRRAQRRMDRSTLGFENNIMDLARKLQGLGQTDTALSQVLTVGGQMQAGRLGSRALQFYDQTRFSLTERQAEISNRVAAAEKARAEQKSMLDLRAAATGLETADKEIVGLRALVDSRSALANIGSKQSIRKIFSGPAEVSASWADGLIQQLFKQLNNNRYPVGSGERAQVEKRLRDAFISERTEVSFEQRPDGSFQTVRGKTMARIDTRRGMEEIAKIREEREQELRAAQDRLQAAEAERQNYISKLRTGGLAPGRDAADYRKEIEDRITSAQGELERLTGSTTTGGQQRFIAGQQRRLETINKEIKEIEGRQEKLYQRLNELLPEPVANAKELDAVVKKLEKTFTQLADATRKAGNELLEVEGGSKGFFSGLGNRFRSLFEYATAGSVVYTIADKVRRTVTELNQIDSELARLQGLFDGRSPAARTQISEAALNTAVEYGTTPLQTLQSARVFAQTGAGPAESIELARGALASQIALNIDPNTATEMLVSTRNVFDNRIAPFELLDRIARLEARYAVSANDLSLAVQRAGPLFKQFQTQSIGNVDPLDLLLGSTTSIVEKTRVTGNQAATSLRFMLSRIAQPEVARSLQNDFGIMLGGSNPNELRPISEILKDISKRYQELMTPDATGQTRSAEAANLLVTFAGARQANAAAALLEDFNESIRKASEGALAYGDVQERLRIQLDTVEGRFGQFNSSLTKLVESIVVSTGARGVAKGVLSAGTSIMDTLADSPAPVTTATLGLIATMFGGDRLGGLLGKASKTSGIQGVGMGNRAGQLLFGSVFGAAEAGPLVGVLGWFGKLFSKLGSLAGFLAPVGVVLAGVEAAQALYSFFVGQGEKWELGTFDRKQFEEGDLFKDVQATAKSYGMTQPDDLFAAVNAAARDVVAQYGLPSTDIANANFQQVNAQVIEKSFLEALKKYNIDIAAQGGFETLPEQITEAMRIATNAVKLQVAPADDLAARLQSKADEILKDMSERAAFNTFFYEGRTKTTLLPATTWASNTVASLNEAFSAKDSFGRSRDLLGLSVASRLAGSNTTIGGAIRGSVGRIQDEGFGPRQFMSEAQVVRRFYKDFLDLNQVQGSLQERFRSIQASASQADAGDAEKLYARLKAEQVKLLQAQNGEAMSLAELGIEADRQLVGAKERLANQLSLQDQVIQSFNKSFAEQAKRYATDRTNTADADNPYLDMLDNIVRPAIGRAIQQNRIQLPTGSNYIESIMAAAREGLRDKSKVNTKGGDDDQENLNVRLRERLTRPFMDLYRGGEDLLVNQRLASLGRRQFDGAGQTQNLLEQFYSGLNRIAPELRGDILQNQIRMGLLGDSKVGAVLDAFQKANNNTEAMSEGEKQVQRTLAGIDRSQLDPSGRTKQLFRINAEIKAAESQIEMLQGLGKTLSDLGDPRLSKEIQFTMQTIVDSFGGNSEAVEALKKAKGDPVRIQAALQSFADLFMEGGPKLQEALDKLAETIRKYADEEFQRQVGLIAVDRRAFLALQQAEVVEAARRNQTNREVNQLEARGLTGAAAGRRAEMRSEDLRFDIQRERAELERRRARGFDIVFRDNGQGGDLNARARELEAIKAEDDFAKKRLELTRTAYTDLLNQIQAEEGRLVQVREQEFTSLMDGAFSGVREVLMDFDKLQDKPLKTVVQGMAGAFQGKIVDNFLDAIFGPMGVATDKLRSAFDQGAAVTYSKVYDGHVDGMRAAAEMLRQAYIQAQAEANRLPTGTTPPDAVKVPGTSVGNEVAVAGAAAGSGALVLSDGSQLDGRALNKIRGLREAGDEAALVAAAIAAGALQPPTRAQMLPAVTTTAAQTGLDMSILTQFPTTNLTRLDPSKLPSKSRGKWANFAEASMTMGGQIGGSFLGRQLEGGADYSNEGASIGAMLGSQVPFLGPFGGLVGGLLGGLAGGLFGKDEEKDPIPTEVLQKIERNTREAVQAFENQTQLLQLDSRFLNVPTGFTVPGFRPFGAGAFNAGGPNAGGLDGLGGRSSVVYNNNPSIEVNVNVPDGMDPTAVGQQVAFEIQRQLGRMGSSFDTRTM